MFSQATTLHQRFEQQVEQHPRAIAVECDGVRLNYRELNREANRLARRLVEEGIGENKLVLVAVERSCDAVVALLAVLKAGGAFLTEDASPDHPVNAVVADTSSGFAGRGLRVVGCWEVSGSDQNLEARAKDTSLACLAGEETWTHAEALRSLQAKLVLRAGEGLFHALPLDGHGALQCLLPLISGGRLVLASPDELRVPEWLNEARREVQLSLQ